MISFPSPFLSLSPFVYYASNGLPSHRPLPWDKPSKARMPLVAPDDPAHVFLFSHFITPTKIGNDYSYLVGVSDVAGDSRFAH